MESGSSYVFERQPGGIWLQVAKLIPSDGGIGESFGCAVALEGERALIGAYRHKQPASQSGAAYVFERQTGGAWIQTAKLSPADADNFDWIGADVDLQAQRALLGAPQKDVDEPGVPKGAAYVFEQQAGGTWLETARLELPDPVFQDEWGTTVALEMERAFVGTPLRDDLGTSSGAAHVMHLEPLQGEPETISLSGGGVQVFALTGGLHHAGLPFFLLGTASGTTPGLVLPSSSGGPLLLPLNPDGWFLFTVNHPNTPPLYGSLAPFDGLGLAAAGFVVPPASNPALAGLLLHHAYLVLAPPQPVFASNAVPLTLVP